MTRAMRFPTLGHRYGDRDHLARRIDADQVAHGVVRGIRTGDRNGGEDETADLMQVGCEVLADIRHEGIEGRPTVELDQDVPLAPRDGAWRSEWRAALTEGGRGLHRGGREAKTFPAAEPVVSALLVGGETPNTICRRMAQTAFGAAPPGNGALACHAIQQGTAVSVDQTSARRTIVELACNLPRDVSPLRMGTSGRLRTPQYYV